jgi:hypothetical protein
MNKYLLLLVVVSSCEKAAPPEPLKGLHLYVTCWTDEMCDSTAATYRNCIEDSREKNINGTTTILYKCGVQ